MRRYHNASAILNGNAVKFCFSAGFDFDTRPTQKIQFETIRSSTGSSFAAREKRLRSFRGTYHFHPEIEITEIVKGSGMRLVGDDLSPFSTGDLVLIGANLPHRYVTDESSKVVSHARVIQFSPDFLGDDFIGSVEMSAVRRLLSRASQGLVFPHAAAASAANSIARLFKASELRRLIHLLELLDILASCRRPLKLASAGYAFAADSADTSKLDKALNYIHQHLRDPVTLREVAELLGVSTATCNRLFNRTVGKPFKDFLVDVRISHACTMLMESETSVIDVAGQSGFRNLSNFNRLFKARKGESPTAYRKRANR